MAHTPGPWVVKQTGGYHGGDWRGATIFSDSDGRSIASISANSRREPAQIEANARLIEAAPEQYSAAKEIDRLLLVIESAVRNADPSQHRAVLAALQANQAAIAKAEGRS